MFVSSVKMYEEAVAYLNEDPHDEITWDSETTGKDWRGNKICGIPLLRKDQSFYFPFRHKEGFNLPLPLLGRLFREVIRPDRPQVLFHSSYDMKVAGHHDGIPVPNREALFDGILAALAMNENEESFKLEDLCQKYVDANAGKQEERLIDYICQRFGGSRKDAKGNLWKCPGEVVAPYGEQDVWSTKRLHDFYIPHLHKWKLWECYRELCAYQRLIACIEMRGVLLDREAHKRLKTEAEQEASRLLARIHELAGYKLNPNSHLQVKAWLQVKSSNKQTLSRMDKEDERPQLVMKWRKWEKAGNTFYDPYEVFSDSSGVLRCNLHLTSPGTSKRNKHDSRNGTISGRLSSSKPNLQQIPRESDEYKVKELFVARPGYMLVELDYSQAELRIAAHYSKDERLAEILLSGGDMHDIVSQELDIPRHIAKNINFSAWYGIGFRTFARNYYVPERDAKLFLAKYHKMFPGIRRLSYALTTQAEKRHYIRLFHGGIRRYNCDEAPPHTAPNNLIQGSVAGMVRRAQLRIEDEVPEFIQVLQVHDALWGEVLIGPNMIETIERARAIMQDQPWCSMPMAVDGKMGECLGRAKKLPRNPRGIPAPALARITNPGAYGLAA